MIHLLEVEDLKRLIKKNEVCIIDVREESEYLQSKIDGSILIPLGTLTIDKVMDANPENKKLVMQCKSGGRSLNACKMLIDADEEIEVYNLEGGITAWNAMIGSNVATIVGGCSAGSGNGGCSSGGCSSK
jgi:rhodanese-related sulfurtransferase